MRTRISSIRFTFALATLVPILALTWVFAVPDALTPLSYMYFAGLLSALAAVALITFKNAQATDSVGQLLHETDIAAARETIGTGAPRTGPQV